MCSTIHATGVNDNCDQTVLKISLTSAGQALFLTPLIKDGKLDEAKSKSKVGPLGADYEVPGYSGYITVNPQYNSNLFFWFVPSLVSVHVSLIKDAGLEQ